MSNQTAKTEEVQETIQTDKMFIVSITPSNKKCYLTLKNVLMSDNEDVPAFLQNDKATKTGLLWCSAPVETVQNWYENQYKKTLGIGSDISNTMKWTDTQSQTTDGEELKGCFDIEAL